MTEIRNVAIIAHVDHGKTTLVDKIIYAAQANDSKRAQDNNELILDSNDLERERGITILSKNVSVEIIHCCHSNIFLQSLLLKWFITLYSGAICSPSRVAYLPHKAYQKLFSVAN